MKKEKKKFNVRGGGFIIVLVAVSVILFFSASAVLAGRKAGLGSKSLSIKEGESKVLKFNGTDKKVEWSIKKGKNRISLKNVKAGSVTVCGKKAGKAKVQARFKGKSYICNVNVKAKEADMPAETTKPLQTVKPAGHTPEPQDGKEDNNNNNKEWRAITDFGSSLLSNLWAKDDNIMVSPVSIFNALAMTANGASGETLVQFEKLFGLSIEECNNYLKDYNNSLPYGDKYKLDVANSIWMRDTFTPVESFIEKNKEIYGAEVHKSAFDNNTLNDINNWVKEKTDSMIPKIINTIEDDAYMYLINALAFDAEWSKVYEEDEVRDGIFTKENGETEKVPFMYSEEGEYLEDKNTTGFIKYYKDAEYAFVALLPEEGISMEDYINKLNGKKLKNLLDTSRLLSVKAAIPKFKSEYEAELGKVLVKMGIPDAFDQYKADFSGIGQTENDLGLYIDEVLHKTFIEVDENGTKAGAATAVIMKECASAYNPEVKTVYLDRPFVYMLVDTKSWLPAFLGIVNKI